MTKAAYNRWILVLVALSFVACALSIYFEREPVDPTSEGNAFHAAQSYLDKGFSANAGLPDLGYDPNNPAAKVIYTHYPPGAELMVGVFYYVYGPGKPWVYRATVLLFTTLALFIFLSSLPNLLSYQKSLALAILLLISPVTTRAMYGFSYHGYATALLLLEFTLLMHLWKLKTFSARTGTVLFLFAFLQGCLSLDHIFIVSLLPLPFYFFANQKNKAFIYCAAIAGSGFLFANLLHFIQVAVYFGGWREALHDFMDAGAYRMWNAGDKVAWVHSENIRLLNVLRFQFDVLFPTPQSFGFPAQIVMVLVFLACFRTKPAYFGKHWGWQAEPSDRWVLLAALFASVLWTVIMRQHAYIHNFITRHYFVLYFFSLLMLAKNTLRPKRH